MSYTKLNKYKNVRNTTLETLADYAIKEYSKIKDLLPDKSIIDSKNIQFDIEEYEKFKREKKAVNTSERRKLKQEIKRMDKNTPSTLITLKEQLLKEEKLIEFEKFRKFYKLETKSSKTKPPNLTFDEYLSKSMSVDGKYGNFRQNSFLTRKEHSIMKKEQSMDTNLINNNNYNNKLMEKTQTYYSYLDYKETSNSTTYFNITKHINLINSPNIQQTNKMYPSKYFYENDQMKNQQPSNLIKPRYYIKPSKVNQKTKILSWNINSLNAAHRDDLFQMIERERPHMIFLQEHFLNSDQLKQFGNELNLYWHMIANPCDSNGRKGVMILIHKSSGISFEVLLNELHRFITIKISNSTQSNFISNIYLEPDTDIIPNWDAFGHYIIGDINHNHIPYSVDRVENHEVLISRNCELVTVYESENKNTHPCLIYEIDFKTKMIPTPKYTIVDSYVGHNNYLNFISSHNTLPLSHALITKQIRKDLTSRYIETDDIIKIIKESKQKWNKLLRDDAMKTWDNLTAKDWQTIRTVLKPNSEPLMSLDQQQQDRIYDELKLKIGGRDKKLDDINQINIIVSKLITIIDNDMQYSKSKNIIPNFYKVKSRARDYFGIRQKDLISHISFNGVLKTSDAWNRFKEILLHNIKHNRLYMNSRSVVLRKKKLNLLQISRKDVRIISILPAWYVILNKFVLLLKQRSIESILPKNMHAYRKAKGTGSAKLEVLLKMKTKEFKHHIILDIDEFYPSIDWSNNIIWEQLKLIKYNESLKLIIELIQLENMQLFTEKRCLYRKSGIPQGDPLGPHLSSIFLSTLCSTYNKNLTAFCDDWIISARTVHELKSILKNIIIGLKTLGLTIDPKKLKFISSTNETFQIILNQQPHTLRPIKSTKYLGQDLTPNSFANIEHKISELSISVAKTFYLPILDKLKYWNLFVRSKINHLIFGSISSYELKDMKTIAKTYYDLLINTFDKTLLKIDKHPDKENIHKGLNIGFYDIIYSQILNILFLNLDEKEIDYVINVLYAIREELDNSIIKTWSKETFREQIFNESKQIMKENIHKFEKLIFQENPENRLKISSLIYIKSPHKFTNNNKLIPLNKNKNTILHKTMNNTLNDMLIINSLKTSEELENRNLLTKITNLHNNDSINSDITDIDEEIKYIVQDNLTLLKVLLEDLKENLYNLLKNQIIYKSNTNNGKILINANPTIDIYDTIQTKLKSYDNNYNKLLLNTIWKFDFINNIRKIASTNLDNRPSVSNIIRTISSFITKQFYFTFSPFKEEISYSYLAEKKNENENENIVHNSEYNSESDSESDSKYMSIIPIKL